MLAVLRTAFRTLLAVILLGAALKLMASYDPVHPQPYSVPLAMQPAQPQIGQPVLVAAAIPPTARLRRVQWQLRQRGDQGALGSPLIYNSPVQQLSWAAQSGTWQVRFRAWVEYHPWYAFTDDFGIGLPTGRRLPEDYVAYQGMAEIHVPTASVKPATPPAAPASPVPNPPPATGTTPTQPTAPPAAPAPPTASPAAPASAARP